MSVVKRNHPILRKQLDVESMCSALLAEGVINEEDYDQISTRKDNKSTHAARDLLMQKMFGRGKASHLAFVEALVEHNAELAEEVALAEERRNQAAAPLSNAGLSRADVVLRTLRSAVDNDFTTMAISERTATAGASLQCSEEHPPTADAALADGTVEPKLETGAKTRDSDGVPLPTFLPLKRRDFLRGRALDPWESFVQPHFFAMVMAMHVESLVPFCFQNQLLTPGEKVRILSEPDDMKRRDCLLQSLFHTHWLGFQTVMAELERLPPYQDVVELVSRTLLSTSG